MVGQKLYSYVTQEWYTPAEVAVHNKTDDCWVSLNGKVLDLTSWLQDQFRLCTCTKTCSCEVKSWFCADDCVEYCNCFRRGYFFCDAKRLATTIVAYAGKDISHWFSGDDWIQYIHPQTGTKVPFMQHGHGIRQPVVPSTKWRPTVNPWWLNEDFVVGRMTAKTRPIQFLNTINGLSVTLEVCSEETVNQILMRYYPHNTHMDSYSLRFLGRRVHGDKTLEENGIPDQRETFTEVALPENTHIPAILMYYNDDLTEDPPRSDCFCEDLTCKLHRPEHCFDKVYRF